MTLLSTTVPAAGVQGCTRCQHHACIAAIFGQVTIQVDACRRQYYEGGHAVGAWSLDVRKI